jgi:hypothetical protein
VHVLQAAIHVAKTPEEVAAVQARIDEIKQYQASVASSQQMENASAAPSTNSTVTDTRTMTITNRDGSKFVLKPDSAQGSPKYPTEAPTGPHHMAQGVIRNVQCSYPTILTLNVDQTGKSQAISLYRNDFYQIQFIVTNFTPKGNINPCTDIEGFKARVEYAEVSDKSIAGQILSIELSK